MGEILFQMGYTVQIYLGDSEVLVTPCKMDLCTQKEKKKLNKKKTNLHC